MTNDPASEAARLIRQLETMVIGAYLDECHIAAIIRSICRVPRCETCAHWGPFADQVERKECCHPKVGDGQMKEFMTTADFGCVLWKEKS